MKNVCLLLFCIFFSFLSLQAESIYILGYEKKEYVPYHTEQFILERIEEIDQRLPTLDDPFIIEQLTRLRELYLKEYEAMRLKSTY